MLSHPIFLLSCLAFKPPAASDSDEQWLSCPHRVDGGGAESDLVVGGIADAEDGEDIAGTECRQGASAKAMLGGTLNGS